MKTSEKWKVLIVDDDESAHDVARLQFKRLKVSGKKIELLSAYSGEEALEILRENPKIALMIVDMVMENDHAGAILIAKARDELHNTTTRIIIRSGCIDLVDKILAKGFTRKNDVGHVFDKADIGDGLLNVVASEIKRYKIVKGVFYLFKVFVIKVCYDLIKRYFT